MAMHRSILRSSLPSRRAAMAAVLVASTALATTAHDARADQVSPTGKGIVGGALLGGEVVTIVESLAGVHAGWAYWLGAIVGAGGGGVGGWAVEQGSTDGVVPMAMLAAGLGLVIPAMVLSLDATRYRPDEGATEDHVPTGPAAEPGATSGSVVGSPPPAAVPPPSPAPATPPSPAPGAPPQSLLDLHRGDFRVGVPVPDVRPVFSLTEQRQYGMHAETELRLPVLHVTF
jgi:hypothetical protein